MDYAATTPVSDEVFEALSSVLSRRLGNAQSKHHVFGSAAHLIVQESRNQVANCIGASGDEIIFTSGATEANNLVLKGLAPYLHEIGRRHIVTCAVEHASILGPLRALEEQGFKITVLPVMPCGMIDAQAVARALESDVGLVSIQAVNNELGTIQPLSEIRQVLAGRNILFHTDAAQALGKLPFSVAETGVDFATLSAHKVYGPQGVGALFVKSHAAELLTAQHSGGGQESGLRSGTLPVALVAGFGAACQSLANDRDRLQDLREQLLAAIDILNPRVHGHSDPAWNVPGILNLRFPGIDSETLMMALPGLAFGAGSACSSTGKRKSHVLKAITGSDRAAEESIRLSFGRGTSVEQIYEAASLLVEAVSTIREIEGVI